MGFCYCIGLNTFNAFEDFSHLFSLSSCTGHSTNRPPAAGVADVCAALQARWPQLGIVDQQFGDVVDSLAMSLRSLGMFRGCEQDAVFSIHFMAS